MLPQATFIQIADADSDNSLENEITDCQNQYSTTMKEWENIYPIQVIETLSQTFWKDTNEQWLVIPPNDLLKRCLMKVWHDSPTAGHPGQDEMVQRINCEYYWPSVRSWIQEYVKGCATCQQNKNLTHRLKTPLFRIPADPKAKPFSHVAMDLITGLPKSKGYDAILTIVDHGCSWGTIFLPCTTTIMGPQIAKLYLDHLYRWFGLPKQIISDRDPQFTSHFGRTLTKELGIQQNLSTAFHPQTDGLSERKNQWVEQYLRLITTNQEDWSDWLAIATLVHNNSANSTTSYAPNELLIGWEPPMTTEQGESSKNSTAEEQATNLQNNRILATQAINRTAQKNSPTTPSEKINFSYSILLHLTTSYSSYFGGKKGISRNKTSFFLLMTTMDNRTKGLAWWQEPPTPIWNNQTSSTALRFLHNR